MHITNANIFEMAKGKAKLLLSSNVKSYMGSWLAYLHLTSTYFIGYGQGHAHFDMKILEIVT